MYWISWRSPSLKVQTQDLCVNHSKNLPMMFMRRSSDDRWCWERKHCSQTDCTTCPMTHSKFVPNRHWETNKSWKTTETPEEWYHSLPKKKKAKQLHLVLIKSNNFHREKYVLNQLKDTTTCSVSAGLYSTLATSPALIPSLGWWLV